MVREVKWVEAEEAIRTAPFTPVVYFTASWCMPCRQMKPQFAKAGVRDADREYLIVDIDEAGIEVQGKYGIQSVPTILAMPNLYTFAPIRARKSDEIIEEVYNTVSSL